MRFNLDRASLIVRGNFTIFALFYVVFEGNFPSTSPREGLYLEGRFNGGFFALPVWGAYFRNSSVFLCFTQFGGRFYCYDFDKFRYAAPLMNQ